MKTRSKKGAVKPSKQSSVSEPSKLRTLEDNVEIPPHVFILPKHVSPAARILTLPNGATGECDRHLVCPEGGFYEFTRISGPRRVPRSWLLTSEREESGDHQSSTLHRTSQTDQSDDSSKDVEAVENASQRSGYVLSSPDLFVATPIDPLFILLPTLLGSTENIGQEFLAPSDYMVALTQAAPHLRSIIRPHAPGRLEQLLEQRLEAVCDCLDMGDDKMYALSLPKLVKVLVSKAKQTVAKGLPASLEAQFIKHSLDIPDLGVERSNTGTNAVSEDTTSAVEIGATPEQSSQDSTPHTNNFTGSGTAAITKTASMCTSSGEESYGAPSEIVDVLRLQTVFNFLVASYVPLGLHSKMHTLLRDQKCSDLNFAALDKHLAHVEGLKRQAQALRTLSDNVSRKRSATEDEEATEKAEAKRRKKEEEESKKRSMSQGVKQLMKADTSGMKKLSAFFSKAPVK